MEAKKERWGNMRGGQTFIKSGKWDDYWTSNISYSDENRTTIRGYPLYEIIEKLTYAEAVYLICMGELPDEKQTKVMNALLLSIIENDFVGPNPPITRYIASAYSQTPIPAIAGGLLAIGNYTASPKDATELIKKAYNLMKSENLTITQTAEKIVKEYIANKERIPGFGHPYFPDKDARAVALRKVAMENGFWSEQSQLYEAINVEYRKATGRSICINIDGMMACVGNDMGFDPLEMAGFAAISLIVGLVPHAVAEMKEGTPVRGIPPVIKKYTGPAERHLPSKG